MNVSLSLSILALRAAREDAGRPNQLTKADRDLVAWLREQAGLTGGAR